MTRFIIVTFGFLAIAFYQMSGGSDFVPRSAQLAAQTPQADQPAEAGANAGQDPEFAVTRVSLDLVSVDDVLAGKRTGNPLPQVEAVQPEEISEPEKIEIETTVIASLIEGAVPEGGAIEPAAVDIADTELTPLPVVDLRSVTANRVNVRGGPGTEYGIVGKLERGNEVEILEDPGLGWVRIRTADSGELGWLADFLLSDG